MQIFLLIHYLRSCTTNFAYGTIITIHWIELNNTHVTSTSAWLCKLIPCSEIQAQFMFQTSSVRGRFASQVNTLSDLQKHDTVQKHSKVQKSCNKYKKPSNFDYFWRCLIAAHSTSFRIELIDLQWWWYVGLSLFFLYYNSCGLRYV